MSANMDANVIRTHAHTNQRRTLDRGCGNPWTQDSFRPFGRRGSVLIQAR